MWQQETKVKNWIMKLVIKNIILIVISAVIVSGTGEWSEDAEDLVSTVEVDAVLGRTASLPCDLTPDTNEDRVYMVLWFRKSGGKPIYSFDVRGRSFNKALQWSDPGAFGPRAYFVTVARPAALTLSSVQLDDEGTYRCRVDFKNSPTRNFQIRLIVIVPPHQMLLYDKSGGDISGVFGPVEEGSALVLICEVRGGKPEPVVSWLIDGTPATQYIGEKTDTHVVVNRLELQHVRRGDLNKTFKCRAGNTHLVPPQEKAVRLEMNLAPLSVSLLNRPQKLLAGATTTLRCVAEGSRPPAEVTWYKDNRSFEKNEVSDHSNETWTVSTLVFTPTPEDHGLIVKCVAVNVALPSKSIDDQLKLNVVYSPLVSLTLGSTLNPHDIKEGDDVYFECNVKANPREHRITWYHNDRQVTQNMTSGIILSTRSLVLQRVTRREAGQYSCRAANARGETSSETVLLRVQYAPVCGMSSPRVVGAALDESLQVRCSVNADPADVVFLWQFNNSGESFNVSPARYGTLNGSTSELRYTPASERDYGALTCRGTNSVGQQAQPCVFQIVPAARPSPPRNCTVSTGNNSNWIEDSIEEAIDYLVVKCVAGYDGGLPQLVVLEALDSHSGVLRLNITANETNGVVVFLVPLEVLWSGGKALRLTVHSKNDKGASDRIVIQALSYQDPERRTDGSQSLMSGMSSTAFWTIILTILFCTSCALVTILFIRKKRARATSKQQTQELQLNSDGRQYVVAYTLKPPKQAQPDILNPQPDGNSLDCGVDAVKNGTFHTSESDSREQASISDKMSTSSSTMANKLVTISTSTLSRREHLIAEEIPGPESCV
ncbi:synaptogenesis protein syg-2-like isoform X1 [Danaus plexippus]|uniref:synaptogenesis protein syg-2-like isoform X1 n=1 Tax=Danaus plexippus TaxID=13037 RepID=UPI002AB06086|nr:synaptogenesis protein syg-2-like isoform X1 [Danaus plexippus]XP_061384515.1 synaptogenesis protein syg-2-like isoform X1 [Danaus plexippus]